MTPELREGILTRDGWTCVRCPERGTEVHHRRLKSQGGQDAPSNLILMCLSCHATAHSLRADVGVPGGFIVASWEDPVLVPVATPGGLVLLDDAYGRVPV